MGIRNGVSSFIDHRAYGIKDRWLDLGCVNVAFRQVHRFFGQGRDAVWLVTEPWLHARGSTNASKQISSPTLSIAVASPVC